MFLPLPDPPLESLNVAATITIGVLAVLFGLAVVAAFRTKARSYNLLVWSVSTALLGVLLVEVFYLAPGFLSILHYMSYLLYVATVGLAVVGSVVLLRNKD